MSGNARTLHDLLAEADRRERGPLAAFAVLALGGAVAEAAVPWLMGTTLDAALRRDGWGGYVLLLALAVGAGIATNVSRHVLAARLKLRIAAGLRDRIAERVAHASGEVAGRVPIAQVATVVGSDVDRVAAFPIARLKLYASVGGMLVVAGYLFRLSPLLTVLVLAGVPAFMWLTTKIAEPLEERQDTHRDALGRVAALGSDIGLGLRILRGLGAERVIGDRFRTAVRETEQAGVRVARTEALLLISGTLLPGVLLTGLIWLGGHLAATGAVAPAALVTFYAAAAYLVAPVSAAAGYGGTRGAARVAAKNVRSVLDTPEPTAPVAEPPTGDLVDEPTGLRVPVGGLSVLAAGSAEGEQLARRLAASGGSVVRFHGPRPVIFSGRVRDGLDPAGRHTDAELAAALEVAAADDVVDRFPHRLDERIDADGRSVSGGQRQRLALARSLLGDPGYLLLVEPTTALDAVTEIEVARRIAAHRRGRTTLVVTRGGAFRAVADHVLTLEETADV